MIRLGDILHTVDSVWPSALADDWDRPGLICGDPASEINRVLFSVDITSDVVAEAAAGNFQLIIAHHPFLLRDVATVAESAAKSNLIAEANRSGTAILAAHTNADVTATGVSASLAKKLGLTEIRPLLETESGIGHGRIGTLEPSMSLLELARQIAKRIPPTAGGVKVAGDPNSTVKKVALCGGAGDSFIAEVIASDAQVYITSDLRHHPVQEAIEQCKMAGRELAFIDISHWAAESIWLDTAAAELRSKYPEVAFELSDIRTDSWDFLVTQ